MPPGFGVPGMMEALLGGDSAGYERAGGMLDRRGPQVGNRRQDGSL